MGLHLFSHPVGRAGELRELMLHHTHSPESGVWCLVVPRILPTAPLCLRYLLHRPQNLSSGIAKAWFGILTLRLGQVTETEHVLPPAPQVNVRNCISSGRGTRPTGWPHRVALTLIILTWFLALMSTFFSNSSFILPT